MAERVFTFNSPVDANEMMGIIIRVVSELEGKTNAEGNIIVAKWRSNKYQTVFPHKFTFYIGKGMVRVVTSDICSLYNTIKWEYDCYQVLVLWDEFVRFLTLIYPDLDFGLERGKFRMVSVNIVSDGVEQTFTSKSVSHPSIGGALIGGALFGGVGAIVGGSGGKTLTSGNTKSVFSKDVLVRARYSNGLNLEGAVSKTSKVYNQIFVNLSELSENEMGK